MVALGPWEPKLLTKTQAFAISQACYSATYGRITPKMSWGLPSPQLHDSTKFHENLCSVCVSAFCFLIRRYSATYGPSGVKTISVLPSTTLHNLTEFRVNRCNHSRVILLTDTHTDGNENITSALGYRRGGGNNLNSPPRLVILGGKPHHTK